MPLNAVDGHDIQPIKGRRFGLAMGQRLDIAVDLNGSGAFPILVLREGAREQTGVILATPGAKVSRVTALTEKAAPAFDTVLSQESALCAAKPLPVKPASNTGCWCWRAPCNPMSGRSGQTWATHQPIPAKTGERVELMRGSDPRLPNGGQA